MITLLRISLAVMTALSLFQGGFGQTEPLEKSLTRPITTKLRQAQIGELLELWTKEAGISLTADDVVASQVVVIYMEKRPLSEAMEALRALVSVRNAPAEWKAIDAPGGTKTYRLRLHPAFASFVAGMDDRIQQDYRRLARSLLTQAKLSDAELEKAAKNNEEAKSLADPRAKDTRAGLQFLNEALSEEQIENILQGKGKFEAKTKDLPPAFQQFLEIKETVRSGVFQHLKPYTRVRVATVREEFEISPALLIYLGNDTGLEYNGYAGGYPLDKKWGAKFADAWKEDGKSRAVSSPLQKPMEKSEKAAEMDFSPRDDLRKVAQATSHSLIALCLPQKRARPGEGGASPDDQIYGKTLEDWLIRRYPLHKWSGQTLLINYPTWFRHWDKMPSYRQTKLLRQREEKQEWLYPADFCAAAKLLTDRQCEFLSRMDFPIFEQIGENRALWASLSPPRKPPTPVMSNASFPLTPELMAALPLPASEKAELSSKARIRLYQSLDVSAGPPSPEKAVALFYFTRDDYGIARDAVEKDRLQSVWLTLEREGMPAQFLSGFTYPDYASRRTRSLPLTGQQTVGKSGDNASAPAAVGDTIPAKLP